MTKKIKVSPQGPYLVTGEVPLSEKEIVDNGEGGSTAYKTTKKHENSDNYALCRCGHSSNKPFCDGSHLTADWDGTETAPHAPYEDLIEQTVAGDGIELLDAASLCASARFCHPNGGTWDMVANAQTKAEKQAAIDQCCRCPSGRLVIRDTQTGKIIEEDLPQAIAATYDTPAGKNGPLHVTGGVEIEDGTGKSYPTRNRVTLCRCGRSGNKPFCDSSHLEN